MMKPESRSLTLAVKGGILKSTGIFEAPAVAEKAAAARFGGRKMSSQDIRNNALVHAILVRNYLNTQRVEHAVIGDVVSISGAAELRREADLKSRSAMEAVVRRTLEKVEGEIKKLPGIQFVKFNLDNWVRQGHRWVCTSIEPAPHARKKIAGEEKRVPL